MSVTVEFTHREWTVIERRLRRLKFSCTEDGRARHQEHRTIMFKIRSALDRDLEKVWPAARD